MQAENLETLYGLLIYVYTRNRAIEVILHHVLGSGVVIEDVHYTVLDFWTTSSASSPPSHSRLFELLSLLLFLLLQLLHFALVLFFLLFHFLFVLFFCFLDCVFLFRGLVLVVCLQLLTRALEFLIQCSSPLRKLLQFFFVLR